MRWPVETRLLVVSSWVLIERRVCSAIVAELLVRMLVMVRTNLVASGLGTFHRTSGLAPGLAERHHAFAPGRAIRGASRPSRA
ncbi:hypothetical protein GCM10007886_23510 [Methylobacterium gregans]|nr:hypothetical protein GCM10007886_23510 [Methylobacterium gregans]